MARNYFLDSFFTGLSVGIELKRLMMDIEEKEALEEAGDTLADAEGEDWTKGQGPGADATTEAINTMAEASAMGADGSIDPANIPSAAADLMDSAAKAGADIKMPEPKEGSGNVRLPQGVSGEDLDFNSVEPSDDPRALDMGTGSMTQEAKLGMIGGVKPDGGVYQSLDGQGDAHSEEPGYKDYSQLFREYRFDRPNENWIQVGERDGKPVYAAPDYARDEDGNYINVSASEAQALARERGSLVPTRDEYKTLFEKANPIAMATSGEFGKKTADVTPQEYTAAMQARLQEAGIDPGRQPVVHGKEFFRDSMPAQPAQQNFSQPNSLAGGIVETAEAIGADPLDLATVISYETGGTFDPAQPGPVTQHGKHRGLIQFGEPQARAYGVNWDRPAESQLGRDGAIAKYFKDNGYKPGMGLLDLYSTVNAGAPGRYNASDANNGGAPGTVADKVENQMAPHRKKAKELLSIYKPVEKGINLDPGTQGVRPAIPEPEKEEKETPRPLFEQTGRGAPPIPMDDGGSV